MKKNIFKLSIIGFCALLIACGIGYLVLTRGKATIPHSEGGSVTIMDSATSGADEPKGPRITRDAGIFADGQPYASYQTDDFEVIYPDWQSASTTVAANESWQIFVSNKGCNVIVRPVRVAEGLTYRQYVDNTIKDAEPYQPIFNKKEVTNTTAFVDAEIPFGSEIVRNVSYNYLTSKGVSYGIAFVSEKSNFGVACQPYVDDVVKSVKVK